MADNFNTNEQPGFHILISLIEIWTPKDKKKPNGEKEGETMYITEVEEVEIEETYKKLIGSASVRFPRGTIVRSTITPETAKKSDDYSKITAAMSDSGVVEETRLNTSVASQNTFHIGQRIKIYLGYTTDPKIADMAKTSNTGKSIFNDSDTRQTYYDAFKYTDVNQKKHMSLMFDGFITKVSLDTPIELECENLASFLKTITCPNTGKLHKCEVKDFLGENGRFKLLQDTGLKLHSLMKDMEFDLGGVQLHTDLTVADVLIKWTEFGLFSYIADDNGEPAIMIGRAYFSNPGSDSLLNNPMQTKTPVPIHFDYHVADNGLTLLSADKDFLAVQATGITNNDKFIKITVIRNLKYDPSKPNSESNAPYRHVNESKLSRKAIKAGKKYLTSAPEDRVDMKPYTQIAFVSKNRGISIEQLAEEATKYLEGYNANGIEGTLTIFGDLHIHTAQQVELIDNRYPGKNGIYFVEEVNTTFGTKGFRQRLKLPYCIKRNGNEQTSN